MTDPPRYWMATLIGGPHDGERVTLDTIWPRVHIWPTMEHPEVAEYRRIDYDLESATCAYLINEEEVSP